MGTGDDLVDQAVNSYNFIELTRSKKRGLSQVNLNIESSLPISNANVKKRRGRPPKATKALEKENTIVYCVCNNVDYGQMILCDNKHCKIGWFHFDCVGLALKPKGKWFCNNCKL